MYSCIVLIALLVVDQANAQKFADLDKSPHDISYYRVNRGDAPLVKVVYGRPQLKDRDLETLAPAGKVWRTGANEATEVTFYKDVTIGDKSVKAGTYVLHTIPGANEWTVIFNSNLNVWGTYQYDEKADVARISASASTADDVIEAFSIAFSGNDNGADMVLAWGKTRVVIPISFK